MNGYGAAAFNDFVGHIQESANDLVCWIGSVVEIEFHVVDSIFNEGISVVEFRIEANDQLDVALLEVVDAVLKSDGKLAFERGIAGR